MNREISVGGNSILYQVRKNRRSKRVKISVYLGGRIVVTIPWYARARDADKLVLEKSGWILEKLKYLGNEDNLVSQPEERKNYLKHKEEARKLVHEKIQHFNKIYGYKFRRVHIRDQRTRWGSCSCLGNLNFNYRIIYLPGHLIDYIVVHELCHLEELNHSPAFWSLVSKTLPDYQELRRELKGIKI